MYSRLLAASCLSLSLLLGGEALADSGAYSVIFGGVNVGHVNVNTEAGLTHIETDIKNNGRGPTIHEVLKLDAGGLPLEWSLSGTTTFGSNIDEHFSQKGKHAEWLDAAGKGQATVNTPTLYIAQSGSAWSDGLYARALLKSEGRRLAVLPGGELHLEKGETFEVQGKDGAVEVTQYDLTGLSTTPDTILLDARGELFALVDPSSVVVRQGYEGEEVRLRELAAGWVTHRYENMQREVAHRYGRPVRIKNVRVFDPHSGALSAPASVLTSGNIIAALETADSPATPGEVTIDGQGGVLIAGLFEMHGHLGQDDALLNVLAGVTTVRDMGNDNAVLDKLIERIDSGVIGGPRVVRSPASSRARVRSAPTMASWSTVSRRPSTRCAGTAHAATGRSRSTTA